MNALTYIFSAGLLLASNYSNSTQPNLKSIHEVVEKFGSSLGCNFHMDQRNIVPWKDKDGTAVLVLFSIDYGCSGGTTMDRPVLAIVRTGARSTLFIDQSSSIPNRTSDRFPANIERIYGHGKTIQYLGRRLRPTDALCCASQKVKGTVSWTPRGWEPKNEQITP